MLNVTSPYPALSVKNVAVHEAALDHFPKLRRKVRSERVEPDIEARWRRCRNYRPLLPCVENPLLVVPSHTNSKDNGFPLKCTSTIEMEVKGKVKMKLKADVDR